MADVCVVSSLQPPTFVLDLDLEFSCVFSTKYPAISPSALNAQPRLCISSRFAFSIPRSIAPHPFCHDLRVQLPSCKVSSADSDMVSCLGTYAQPTSISFARPKKKCPYHLFPFFVRYDIDLRKLNTHKLRNRAHPSSAVSTSTTPAALSRTSSSSPAAAAMSSAPNANPTAAASALSVRLSLSSPPPSLHMLLSQSRNC